MRKEYYSEFTKRQYMQTKEFEVFYYTNQNLEYVPAHTHDYYEIYYFIDGDVEYRIGGQTYVLQYGDYLLIPPGISHQPTFTGKEKEYRRLVLWLSVAFFEQLCTTSADFAYSFNHVKEAKQYHFRTEFITHQQIQGRFLELIEESNTARPFRDSQMKTMIASLLLQINRITYDMLHQVSSKYQNTLYLNLCDYINNHLEEDLTLDQLATFFFVSKYHISHTFKENMGISLHQYIIKKRIHASKNGILSGIPISNLLNQYGFKDYSSFYRAFKKEYGISPTEYREQHKMVMELTL